MVGGCSEYHLETNDSIGSFSNREENSSQTVFEFREKIGKFSGEIPEEVFIEYYDLLGPLTMLEILDNNPSCHIEAHNLGRAVFKKLKDVRSAMEICGNKCRQACKHGALMAYFMGEGVLTSASNHNGRGITADFGDVLNVSREFCEMPDSMLDPTTCYHSLGHVAFFLSNGNVSSALDKCKQLPELGREYYCAQGAYMQHELYLESSELLKDPFTLCDTSEFPAGCFRYRVKHLLENGFKLENIIDHCSNLSQNLLFGCFHGVAASQFPHIKITHEMSELPVINSTEICLHLDGQKKDYCMKGMEKDDFSLNKSFDRFILSRG